MSGRMALILLNRSVCCVMIYGVIVIVIVIIVAAAFTAKRNNAIKQSGIETDAVVTRVREDVSTDDDGSVSYSYTFFVTYRTLEGQTVEAQLASGKSFDIRIGKNVWDRDLHEGSRVRIKYLPEKPNYVIRIDA